MVSERKRRSNRANARNSTGPRTPAGKQRASRNAFRHGLSVDVELNPDARAWVGKATRELVKPFPPSADLDRAARELAAAFYALRRVSRVRAHLLSTKANDQTLILAKLDRDQRHLMRWALEERLSEGQALAVRRSPWPYSVWSDEVRAAFTLMITRSYNGTPEARRAAWISAAIPELVRLERYETRAASRMRRALQAFEDLIAEARELP